MGNVICSRMASLFRSQLFWHSWALYMCLPLDSPRYGEKLCNDLMSLHCWRCAVVACLAWYVMQCANVGWVIICIFLLPCNSPVTYHHCAGNSKININKDIVVGSHHDMKFGPSIVISVSWLCFNGTALSFWFTLWVKTGSREIGFLNYRIALKFDRLIGSTAAGVPVKFQSDRAILVTNLAASRLYEILQ